MSYINEALKKAQKDRDIRILNYGSILKKGADEHSGRKLAEYIILGLILVFLMVVFFFRSDLNLRTDLNSGNESGIPKPDNIRVIKETSAGNDINVLYSEAGNLYKAGQLYEAKRLYEDILNLDPGYVDALNNLGIIHLHEREFQSARRYFEKAILLNPEYVEPCYNLACLYAITGEKEKSIEYLKKSVSLNPITKNWARTDTDLSSVKNLPEFKSLVSN